ncbi:hypothetical protein DRP04_06800 [Archaeoglobales archaeon]|nr:MAG: hypothetical protein DRP04_06800 [Archaeoglobales archaeon]
MEMGKEKLLRMYWRVVENIFKKYVDYTGSEMVKEGDYQFRIFSTEGEFVVKLVEIEGEDLVCVYKRVPNGWETVGCTLLRNWFDYGSIQEYNLILNVFGKHMTADLDERVKEFLSFE